MDIYGCHKHTVNKTKAQPTAWKEIFSNMYNRRRININIYKEFLQINEVNSIGEWKNYKQAR